MQDDRLAGDQPSEIQLGPRAALQDGGVGQDHEGARKTSASAHVQGRFPLGFPRTPNLGFSNSHSVLNAITLSEKYIILLI